MKMLLVVRKWDSVTRRHEIVRTSEVEVSKVGRYLKTDEPYPKTFLLDGTGTNKTNDWRSNYRYGLVEIE